MTTTGGDGLSSTGGSEPTGGSAQDRALRARFGSMWADLADVGRDPVRGGYSRHVFDDADLAMREWFIEQANRRGLDVQTDRNGNIWGWWHVQLPPAQQQIPQPPERQQRFCNGDRGTQNALVTGSHLDSVPGGGAFDGPLGVVSALLAVDELRARGAAPTRPVAVVVMAEEEGGRFGLPCLGSRLLTGTADPDAVRSLTDRDGITFADAARRGGLDAEHIGPDPERLASIGTFVELHVEQGRLMHRADPDAPVAVGSKIVAHGRWRVTITGHGNHAGTTAIADRRDPMVVAADAVLLARRAASVRDDAMVTVGRIRPVPGGTNVIASSVDLWLDARYGASGDTDALVASLVAQIRQHAANEGCAVDVHRESASPEVRFDPALGDRLSAVVGGPVVPTGAGHDAGVFSAEVPAGMLYVRNPTGVSHAPDEFAETDDCLAGITALTDALEAELTVTLTPTTDRGA
jgi:N-carbamoyl-L-amino-acid hydrolase